MENPEANAQANPQAGQAGQDGQMQQVMQMVQQMLQQGAQPVEVAQKLLQEQMPPEAIMEVFTQMGMQPEEAQAAIQQAMQGGQQQQGQGEEQMEGQASNPQEEAAEGAPQGGQPSPEEMAMMQQQGAPPMPGMAQGGAPDLQAQADQLTAEVQAMMEKGATAEQVQQELMAAVKNGDVDEQVGTYVLQQLSGQQQAPVARFGGNARALIQKALGGGMPEVDPTSNSYIQDRQAAFVKSVKKNALLHDFDNEFPSLKKSAPKFAGGGPNPNDYKTSAEYQVAMYKHNAAEKDATKHLNVDDLASKWSAPIAEGTAGTWAGNKFVPNAEPTIAEGSAGKWIGGKFVADAAATAGANQPKYFNNTPEQQNLAKLQASPFGRFMSNSGWDHGDMKVNSSGMPLTNDPNAKFTVTHGEAKKGIFGRQKVAFDLDWSTAGNTGNAPGSIPAAPGITEKKVGDQTLRFDAMGNQLSVSKYDPKGWASAEQAKKEDDLYAQYKADKTYDPATGKFADVKVDRKVNTGSWNNGTIYTKDKPLPADDIKALQATMGVPETGVWDDAFTKGINDYKLKTFGKNANLNGSIGTETGDKLLADYIGKNFDESTRIDQITTANPNAGLANDYQRFSQFDANAKIKTATDAATVAATKKAGEDRTATLTKADEVYNQRGRVYRAFHDSPTENANEYQKELDATKAEEERQRALDAANPYIGKEAVPASSTNPATVFPSLTAKTQVATNTADPAAVIKPVANNVGSTTTAQSAVTASNVDPGSIEYNDAEYSKHSSAWGAMPTNSPTEKKAANEYWDKFLLPQVDAKSKRESDALNVAKTKMQKEQSIVKGTPTEKNTDGLFNAEGKDVYYDPYEGKYKEYAFGGPSDNDIHNALQVLKMALGGMTYKNNYDFLPKAVDGTGMIPVEGLATNPNSMVWGTGTPTTDVAGNKIDPTLPASMQKNDNITIDPNQAAKSGKGKVTGKSKLKVSWADGYEAASAGMEKFGNWTEQMHNNTPGKNMAMNSAMNTTRTGMNDQGNFNQWGENEGGINRGDQVNNMGNTYGAIDTPQFNGWNSEVIKSAMGGPMTFSHGGKVYDLGGAYDLTDADVAALEAAGIKLERNR